MAEPEETTETKHLAPEDAVRELAETKLRLNEFRENNKKSHLRIQELESTLGDLTRQFETSKQEESAEVEEKKSLAERIATLEESNRQKDAAIQAANQEQKRSRIQTQLTRTLKAAGATDLGAEDAAHLVLPQWDEEEGKLAYKPNGTVTFSEDRPGEPLSPEEWARGFLRQRPHFSQASQGDGKTSSTRTVNGKLQIVRGSEGYGAQLMAAQTAGKEYEIID